MRIATAADRSGLSIDTIRYYEKSGILPPIHRGADGQRRFSTENIEWLTLLYWLRETGMPMKTMYRFATLYQEGEHTIPDRQEILLAHAEHLTKRRTDLDRCEDILAYKLAMYRKYEEREAQS